jgi:glycine/D-amino acid oxidase-like deaminating enzyme
MRKIAIIGGGAVGSSIAYHLASHPAFRGDITVVERDPTYRIASSSLSASSTLPCRGSASSFCALGASV